MGNTLDGLRRHVQFYGFERGDVEGKNRRDIIDGLHCNNSHSPAGGQR